MLGGRRGDLVGLSVKRLGLRISWGFMPIFQDQFLLLVWPMLKIGLKQGLCSYCWTINIINYLSRLWSHTWQYWSVQEWPVQCLGGLYVVPCTWSLRLFFQPQRGSFSFLFSGPEEPKLNLSQVNHVFLPFKSSPCLPPPNIILIF